MSFLVNPYVYSTTAGKILTYQTTSQDAGNFTTYTFTGLSIGTATSDRIVHLGVSAHAGGNRIISSVTIGGVTATDVVHQQHSNGDRALAAIYTAEISTGTTADIVVTFSGQMYSCGVGIWTSTGLSSAAAYDTGTSTSDPGSATVNTLNGGFCIGVSSNTDTSLNSTWNNITEQYDVEVGSSRQHVSGAHVTTIAGTLSPSCNFPSSTAHATAFATW